MALNNLTEEEIQQLMTQKGITEDIIFALDKIMAEENFDMDDKEIEKIDTIFHNIRAQIKEVLGATLMNQLENSRQNKKKLTNLIRLIGFLPGEGSNEILTHILFNEKIENMKILSNIDNKKEILNIVKNILEKLVKQLNGKKENKMTFSQEFLEMLESLLKKSFPKLGNSQFKKIEQKAFQEAAQKAFGDEIQKTLMQEVDERYEEFENVCDLLGNLCNWIDNLYDDHHYQEVSEKWMMVYAHRELELAYKRKFWTKDLTPSQETKTDMKGLFPTAQKDEKGQTIELPEELLNSIKSENAIKYITRLARNGKDIRISDLADKFGIDPEVFTEKIMENAKKHNIHFIINGEKKPEVTQTNTTKNEASPTKTITEKELTREEKKLQLIKEYIEKHKDNFNIDTCIKVMDKRGYKITNTKAFKKNFNELYNSVAEKKAFAEELQEVIFPLTEKRNGKNNKIYRTIDLKGFNRILFFEKDTIDGIYNHNEYMKRLRNQK